MIGRSMAESRMTASERGKLLPRKRMLRLRTSLRMSQSVSERSASPRARRRISRSQLLNRPRASMI